MSVCNYHKITEAPGQGASKIQLARLCQRYHFALSQHKAEKILELACGTGIGLACLAEQAATVFGIDIDATNVAIAKESYKKSDNVTVKCMDIKDISTLDSDFDMILLFEAIYYLKDIESVLAKVAGRLRQDGVLVISTVNPEWKDFHPSQYATQYFSVRQLVSLLQPHFKSISFYGGFPDEDNGLKGKAVSIIKRIALRFNLIPGSLKARSYLKRIFNGQLEPLPEKLTLCRETPEEAVLVSSDQICDKYTIIYAVARQ